MFIDFENIQNSFYPEKQANTLSRKTLLSIVHILICHQVDLDSKVYYKF